MIKEDKLSASYKNKKADVKKRGNRKMVDVTFNPTEISSGQDLYVKLSTLPMNHVLIPGSRYLSFTLKNGNNESYHQNNLKSTLFKQTTNKFNGEIYKDLNEAWILKCYEDLWSKSDRAGKIDQGLGGSVNLAKLRSGDASGDNTVVADALLAGVYGKRFTVPIDDDYLMDNGAVYPYALQNTHETILKINNPDKVLQAGGSGKVVPSSFKLDNLKLRYETMENESAAEEIAEKYNTGKSGYYSHSTLVKVFPVTADSTKVHETINLPRKSLRHIVMLFKRNGNIDNSESFYYPLIESVKISFQGQPNWIYAQSMKKYDFYREASRVFFPSDNTVDKNISQQQFFTDKFGLVIDFSTTELKDIQNQGVRLTDTQNAILLEVEKKAGSTGCQCYLFVISDGLLNMMDGQLSSIQY